MIHVDKYGAFLWSQISSVWSNINSSPTHKDDDIYNVRLKDGLEIIIKQKDNGMYLSEFIKTWKEKIKEI